jgi:hypothetical protein
MTGNFITALIVTDNPHQKQPIHCVLSTPYPLTAISQIEARSLIGKHVIFDKLEDALKYAELKRTAVFHIIVELRDNPPTHSRFL